MSKMTLSYNDLRIRVSNFLALTSNGVVPTGMNLTTVDGIITRGIRQFLYPIDQRYGTPHKWSFIEQYWSFTTIGDKWKYSLPIDFSELLAGFSYDEGQSLRPLVKRSAQQIKEMRSYTVTSGWPFYYAIVPQRYSIEMGTTYELWLYPNPSQVYTFSTFYRIDPIKMATTTDLVIGGIMATEAILESCLGVAETQEDDNVTTHHQAKANELIQTAIRFDSSKSETDTIGNLYTGKNLGLDTDTGGSSSRFAHVSQSDIYAQS